jgi:outer membrane immunogenic protein
MQDRTYTFTSPVGGGFFAADRIRQDVDLVTVRVNYRWGGPVIAKY